MANTTTCARLLAYVTALVNQELLLQNEYLHATATGLALWRTDASILEWLATL